MLCRVGVGLETMKQVVSFSSDWPCIRIMTVLVAAFFCSIL